MQHLISVITSAAISHGVVQEKDRELYEYSFRIMLEQVSIGASILIISLLCGVFFETVLYMVLFIPLRIYAGGYHARTFGRCYIISVGAYLPFTLLQHYVTLPNLVIVGVVLFSAIVIICLAPMPDPNKPISKSEKFKFYKIVRCVLMGELLLFALGLWFGNIDITTSISFALFHLALLLIVGEFTFKSVGSDKKRRPHYC